MKPIENWIGTFPIKEAEGRLQKLLAQRADLDNEITELRFWIKRYRERHPTEEDRQPSRVRIKTTAPSPNGAKPTFRNSILSTMAASTAGKEWNLNELRHELVGKGALTRDTKGDLKLLTMLSMMTKANQLERVKQGVYRLKVAAQEARG